MQKCTCLTIICCFRVHTASTSYIAAPPKDVHSQQTRLLSSYFSNLEYVAIADQPHAIQPDVTTILCWLTECVEAASGLSSTLPSNSLTTTTLQLGAELNSLNTKACNMYMALI